MSDEIKISSTSVVPDRNMLSADPAFVQFASQLLQESELADGLEPVQKAKLVAISERRQYVAGDLVFNEHERSSEVYIIESGSVEVWLDPYMIGDEAAEPHRIATLGAGQTCGEMALLDGGVRSARVVAGPHGAKLMAIASATLNQLCETDTAIGYRLMRNLASALALRMRVQDMKLYSA